MTGTSYPRDPQVFPLSGSVGSSRRPLAISRSDLEASVDVHKATSEGELLEGYGVCGRCAGTGRVTVLEAGRPHVSIDCRRCDGTGAKGGTR